MQLFYFLQEIQQHIVKFYENTIYRLQNIFAKVRMSRYLRSRFPIIQAPMADGVLMPVLTEEIVRRLGEEIKEVIGEMKRVL
jgi:hypothetical protein